MYTDVQDFASMVTGKSRKTSEPETKQFPALLSIKSIDQKNRRISAIASTGDIDRSNEIIEPEAFRESLPLFMKNPIVLSAHQARLIDGTSPVVGNVVSANITRYGLEVVLEFHDITPLAEQYWQLYSQKRQRALSVGFIPLEGGFEQRGNKRVYVHRKIEWLELSVVAVPSNRGALTRSKQRRVDFVAEKKSHRQELEEKAEEYARMLLGVDENGFRDDDGLDALGIDAAEADFDEAEFTGEIELEVEPDYSLYFED